MVEPRAEMDFKRSERPFPRAFTSSNFEFIGTDYVAHQKPTEIQSADNSSLSEDHCFLCPEQVEGSDSNMSSASDRTMEQMEAELQSELKRLGLDLEYDNSQTAPCELEVVSNRCDIFSISNGEDFEAEATHEDNVKDISLTCENGVCPRQLERRLYKLLDMRQRDRIAELEAALESANRTMNEMKLEIQWWQNKAHIAHKDGRNSP